MRPSKSQCQTRSDTEGVLIADGGEEDESWKWDPAVDAEPVIESSNDGSEREQPSDHQSDDHTSRSQEANEDGQPRQSQALSDADDEQDSDESESSPARTISRRGLILGGAGVVGTAAVAGGWYVGSGEPTGAKAIASEYVTAIAANDWERIADLYHESASPRQAIRRNNGTDNYEAYLQTNGRLEFYEALDPSVDTIRELEHIPDLSAEGTERIFLAPDDQSGLDAWKQLVVTVTVDTETLALGRRDEAYVDALVGGKTKELILVGTVSDNREWFLWDTNSRL